MAGFGVGGGRDRWQDRGSQRRASQRWKGSRNMRSAPASENSRRRRGNMAAGEVGAGLNDGDNGRERERVLSGRGKWRRRCQMPTFKLVISELVCQPLEIRVTKPSEITLTPTSGYQDFLVLLLCTTFLECPTTKVTFVSVKITNNILVHC